LKNIVRKGRTEKERIEGGIRKRRIGKVRIGKG
jgi:hypothetical protein